MNRTLARPSPRSRHCALGPLRAQDWYPHWPLLTQRSGANAYNITYVYDGVGNRTLLLNGGAATTSTYNATNELLTSQNSAGTTTYTFDDSGNLLTSQAPGDQRTTNTWDGENRLTRVALPSGIVDSFTYNSDGQRVQKQDATGTTNHVWDEENIALETNASESIQAVYTLAPADYAGPISQNRGGAVSFYVFDGLGSTRQLASALGAVTDSYLYQSFGSVTVLSGTTTNPFNFVGREGYYYNADIAQYYLHARFYSPANGLFGSKDPLTDQGTIKAFKRSVYSYVANNPCTASDPSGLRIINRWLYGAWCGLTNGGPEDPIDDIDSCCYEHDKCCDKARGIFNIGCTADMCGCLTDAQNAKECAWTWAGRGRWWRRRQERCERVLRWMISYFCRLLLPRMIDPFHPIRFWHFRPPWWDLPPRRPPTPRPPRSGRPRGSW